MGDVLLEQEFNYLLQYCMCWLVIRKINDKRLRNPTP